MTIKFEKKPTYTFNGYSFDTLEQAQLAAIAAIDPDFTPQVCGKILTNAAALTDIFRQTPRKNASPKPRKGRKAATAEARPA